MDYVNKIMKGDCLEIMSNFPDHSIDMVLADLPYGMTENKWDQLIDLDLLWKEYKRIVKPGGAIVLTSQGAFTGMLINSNREYFKYKMVWIKSKSTNFLNANKQPLRRHEDICVFYKKQPSYCPQKTPGLPYDRGFRKDNQSGSYGKYNTSRILSKDGLRFPSDVLFIEEELVDFFYCKTAEKEGAFHPTQKPVALGQWLVRTYSNPGDVILDNTCGSGSFLVAAVLENRRFIGIEKNENALHMGNPVDFIAISEKRVREALNQTSCHFKPTKQSNQ